MRQNSPTLHLYPGLIDDDTIAILALAGQPGGTTLTTISEKLGKSIERCISKIEHLLTLGFLTAFKDPEGGEILVSALSM